MERFSIEKQRGKKVKIHHGFITSHNVLNIS